MGSNKRHKSEKSRETKKKRHRSRSYSYSPERERSDKHKHHKKHKKKERKDYDSDVEIVSAPLPPKISRTNHHETALSPELNALSRDVRHANQRSDKYYNRKEEKYFSQAKEERINKQRRSPSPSKDGQSSLSIEETNKIRAKLGLKPLEFNTGPKEGSDIIKDDLGEFRHKPAANLVEKERSQKLKEKINIMKEKRKIEASLASVKTLGESDSDDDAATWVKKFAKIEEEKKKAAERAKMLDQMDKEFGLDNLIKEEVNSDLKNAYTNKDLKGLKVEHNLENFKEGSNVILTLKDKAVLEEDDDVLVNVNMIDDERYKKNVLIKSKKPGYNAYDENNFDENGLPKNQILEKYDEEIEGEKRETFIIGEVDPKKIKEQQSAMIKNKLAKKRLESLVLAEPKLANDYYNEQELVKFKKVKKKVRTKKKLQLQEVPDYLKDLGSRRPRREYTENNSKDYLDVLDIKPPKEDLSKIKIEEEDRIMDKKIKQMTSNFNRPISTLKLENIPSLVNEVGMSTEINSIGKIVLTSTAEFCRTLGDIPTYGQSGNREENQEFMEIEVEDTKYHPMEDDEVDDDRGAWNSVKMSVEIAKEPNVMEATILDAEPSLDQGVGGALKLAMSKGYLQKEDSNRPSTSRFAHLKAQNYSIEDKTYGDDDKSRRRDRFSGPTMEFKEKEGFRPNVKLEHIDDDGHVLNAKEAFRYLSHKFHGKGPGKNKIEKRRKKAEQEILMNRMSSTDTPLGTLTLLQAKQKETQLPFIVLSGSKKMQMASISKTKN